MIRAHEQAVAETFRRAGPPIVLSGVAVAVGLVLMLLLPMPLLRGFGVAGLLIPVVSVACALTLMPALLSLLDERLERLRLLPLRLAERRRASELRLWTALAAAVMRRAKLLTALVSLLLVGAAMPLVWIEVGADSSTAGEHAGDPRPAAARAGPAA